MPEIKILIEWYAKELATWWVASSTVCLINTWNKKIITDPWCNREKLMEALSMENLKTWDIDYVFLSHWHPDHFLLASIFENAKYVTYDTNLIYDNDLMLDFDNHVLWENIEILETPGHTLEHLSLLVNTNNWKVIIAGDVIWWTDDEEQTVDIYKDDDSHVIWRDMNQLIESRKNILNIADYIIPGHGKMFKVMKK